MDKYHIEFTSQAEEHLENIINYIKNDLKSPIAARNTLKKLKEGIEKLDIFPERNPLLIENKYGKEGIRRILTNNFYIYYWINLEDKCVQIIAVIYTKREQLTALGKR
ncbi:MAG: type II toxin-antitoxin system RelE/ParE family toxin [Gemella sp.]|nr:type II toxin-antitoxin system RelE/ParE family toxin [Gemella sp.]